MPNNPSLSFPSPNVLHRPSHSLALLCSVSPQEGAIIIGEFRTAIKRSAPVDETNPDAPTKDQLLRAVTWSAAAAAALAVLVVVIVAIPLAVLSNEFDNRTAEIIEGISKVVAALCILQLSAKMPKWLGFYKTKKAGKVQPDMDITLASIRFNVAWNIWREIAECGVFLLPALLDGDELQAIPISAIIGTAVGLVVGFFIYWANLTFTNKLYLAIFTTLLLVFLSTGLFVGGCHEFEEVWGETKKIWTVNNDFWSHKKLPMAILKPFGYSGSRTVLQMTCFWCWLAVSAALHGYKYHQTKKINREIAEGKLEIESESSEGKPEADVEGGKN
jgi:high-affinity iron transporter